MRFFSAQPGHVLRPRLDPIGPERRLAPYPRAEPLLAYLEGRPVLLAQPDPRTRAPGVPADLTVPLTVSRVQRAIDLETGHSAYRYEPTPLVGYEPPKISVAAIVAVAAAAGFGAVASRSTSRFSAAQGAVGGGALGIAAIAIVSAVTA